ncbi:coiled-coil domain-containing protein 12 [Egretta garzetta]|uniref:coiled-coil domain-containing protein 12 n=2 Tax=Neoaves TaxID=3078114 RepID=UPI00163C8555|nr:coiled-coil domain-containing protein 12 [Egretta garzetta]
MPRIGYAASLGASDQPGRQVITPRPFLFPRDKSDPCRLSQVGVGFFFLKFFFLFCTSSVTVSVSPANRKITSPGFIPPKISNQGKRIRKINPTASCYLEAIGESSEKVVGAASKNKDSGERENKQFRDDDEEETVKHKELKLRNYEPEDEELKKRKVPQAKPASVEDKVKDQLEAAKPEPIIDEVDLANLAPRKPDWDLKRDVAKKLEKLEKRTQRAIAELIRERLKGQEEELASAVGSAKQEGSDSD